MAIEPGLLKDMGLFAPLPSGPGESSINSSELLYTPQVNDDLIPKIGQEFNNLEESFEFYNKYAFQGGFSVRHHSTKKNKMGEITRKEYVCCKEGVRATKAPNTRPSLRKRGLVREGCEAKLAVVLNKSSSKYVVKNFTEGHSHVLSTPTKVHLLPSHRKVSLVKRALTKHLGDANVPIYQQMSIFELQAGGLQNVGCTMQDLYNAERDRRKMYQGHDANMLFEHFQLQQENNPGFMFTLDKDDEGRMTRCFWADVGCRKSYQYFGDVVVFDTTYNTNRYSLIFAPIIGVNHHGQSTLFGCAFLSYETAESFEWLFLEWLKAMPAGPPKMIITDQDPAMTKALANVLPNTFHRYCIWHIVSKFSEKIGAVSYKEYYEEFKNCIWNSETREEFDASWEAIVVKANLSTNEWLQNLYKIRGKWVPAYTRDIFSAHMTSSQRAESEHCFFKRYVNSHNSLMDFVTRFDRALARMRHNELVEDGKDVNEKPHLKTASLIELRMSELYTRTMFYKLQEEVFQSVAYVPVRTQKDGVCSVYKVLRVTASDDSRGRSIYVDKSSNHVRCSCKKFESDGLPCRHMLAYFSKKGIIELPNEYILPRWTKATKAIRVFDDFSVERREICDTSLLVKRNRLLYLASKVIDEALLSEQATLYMEDSLETNKLNIAAMHNSRKDWEPSGVRISIPSETCFKEPLLVRAKGCGKRLKGGKEKAVKKSRKCNGCGLTGQSHDKRNCPKLVNM